MISELSHAPGIQFGQIAPAFSQPGGFLGWCNWIPMCQPENFWDVTHFDDQTLSLIQTDQEYPGVSSIDEAIVKNADGYLDITFSPTKPDGDAKWLQTILGKGWNIL